MSPPAQFFEGSGGAKWKIVEREVKMGNQHNILIKNTFGEGICSPPNTGLVIVGGEGTLEFRYPTIPMHVSDQEMKIEHTASSGEKKTIVIPVTNPYQMEVDALAACILDGAQPVVPLSDSREFLITNLALHESAKIGRPVLTGMSLPSS